MVEILFIVNLLSGILMMYKTKKLRHFIIFLVTIALYLAFRNQVVIQKNEVTEIIRVTVYFVFYILVTIEIMKQIWNSKIITSNVIIGLISGYICIGLLGFFMINTIEMLSPGSFNGLDLVTNLPSQKSSVIYFSYITLLTIGYGEIVPITIVAQKATILIGLIGQFYMVLLTATIVGKYISQLDK